MTLKWDAKAIEHMAVVAERGGLANLAWAIRDLGKEHRMLDWEVRVLKQRRRLPKPISRRHGDQQP